MDSTTLAYKIAGAVQKKNPNLTICVITVGFPSGRKVFEYIGFDGDFWGSVAHSEGCFEDIDKEQARWLASTVHVDINQRIEWQKRGKGHASPHTDFIRSDTGTKKADVGRRRKRRGTSFSNISEVPIAQD